MSRLARMLLLKKGISHLRLGGKVSGRSFGIDTHGPAPFDVNKLGPMLEAAHERLSGVWIDCLGWQAFIERWDRKGTLFYLDPPYWGTEHFYGRDLFGREQFELLSAALQCLQGRFILSLNDVPEVRELFAWASRDCRAELPGGRRGAHEAGA
jgi:DNA adenine methylase